MLSDAVWYGQRFSQADPWEFVEFCQRKKRGFEARTHVLVDPGASEIRGYGVLEKCVICAVCEGSMRDLLEAELFLWGESFQDRRRTWM